MNRLNRITTTAIITVLGVLDGVRALRESVEGVVLRLTGGQQRIEDALARAEAAENAYAEVVNTTNARHESWSALDVGKRWAIVPPPRGGPTATTRACAACGNATANARPARQDGEIHWICGCCYEHVLSDDVDAAIRARRSTEVTPAEPEWAAGAPRTAAERVADAKETFLRALEPPPAEPRPEDVAAFGKVFEGAASRIFEHDVAPQSSRRPR